MEEAPSSEASPSAVRQALRVVVVEDSVRDAEIIVRGLRGAGFDADWIRAENETQYLAALDTAPDLIICDYSLPNFDGLRALDLLAERELEIPFVLISGTIGEEKAATVIQRGADDYLLKDRLARLGPAVRRALEIRQSRKERKRALAALHQSERAYRQLVHALPVAIYTTDTSGRVTLFNEAAVELWGQRPNPLDIYSCKMRLLDLNGREIPVAQWPTAKVLGNNSLSLGEEFILERPDASQRHVLAYPHPMRSEDGTPTGAVSLMVDVTELRQAQQALHASELFAQATIDSVSAHICVLDETGKVVAVNQAWREFYRETRVQLQESAPFLGSNYLEVCKTTLGEDASCASAMASGIRQVMDGRLAEFTLEYPCHSPTEQRWFIARVTRFRGASRNIVVAHENVTERKQALDIVEASATDQRRLVQQLETERARLVAAQRVAKVGSWETDLTTLSVSWSEETHRIHEIDPALFDHSHQGFIALVHPADREAVNSAFTRSLDQRNAQAIEHRLLLADGRIKHVEERWQIVFDAQGKALRAVGTCRDVTERKLQELRVMRLNRVQAMMSGINATIARVKKRQDLFDGACKLTTEAGQYAAAWVGLFEQASGRIEVVSRAGLAIAMLDEVLLSAAEDLPGAQGLPGRAIRSGHAQVCNDLRTDCAQQFPAEILAMVALPLIVDNEAIGVFTLCSAESDVFDTDEMNLLAELASDIAFGLDHLRKAERLDYLAYYDDLTGLPNRTLFLDRVAQCIRASAASDRSIFMVVLDLVRFAQINDQLGRLAGDNVLIWVTARLTRVLGDASLLTRLVGDRFALVIAADSQEADVSQFLEKTAAALREDSLCHEGVVIRIDAKFGVARFPDDGADAGALLKHAEVATRLAKSCGEMFAYFSNEMNIQSSRRLALAEQLRVAIDARQFVLHYQPKVDMISGDIVGAEALIRWQHPDKGLLLPMEFIALAEETGLIIQIGAWVIDAVCAQQALWIAAGSRVVPIAVNVSSVQLARKDFLHTVRTALNKHAISSKLLDLELTESALMNDAAEAAGVLQGLRKLGCGLALDDFGTGYASPAYLKRFAFDSVKIDRSFITDITRNAGDAAIATAIIAMAHSLHLKVVAEGIETPGQFNYLRARGCDQMQGFIFSPAIAQDEFASDLRSAKRMQLPRAAPDDQRTLLLVDDEPNISAAVSRLLRRDGYRILTASSGAEALELLAINSVQVIISDQRMPEMSGTELLDTVRQMYPTTIRMILSGYTDLQVVTESVNRGAVLKFLTKPWDDEQLREHVRDAFRRFQTKVRR